MKKFKKTIHEKLNPKIIVHNNDVTKALRILKKKVQGNGLLNELRNRESYQSKGTKERLQKASGRRRWLKKQAETQLPQKRF